MPAKLGYRGFLVEEGTGPELLIVGPDTIPLQLRLLDTAPTTILLKGDRQDVAEEISSGAVRAEINGRKVRRLAPPYEPLLWQTERKRLCNNCYNYATMKATDNFAQPGRGSGVPFPPRFFRGQSVKEAAERDGLGVYVPPQGSGDVRRPPPWRKTSCRAGSSRRLVNLNVFFNSGKLDVQTAMCSNQGTKKENNHKVLQPFIKTSLKFT